MRHVENNTIDPAQELEALREQKQLFEAVLNATTDAVVVLDSGGIILGMNQTYADRFHRSQEEMVGSCVWDLFPSEVTELRKKMVARVVQTGESVRFEDERPGMWNDTVIYPVMDTPGVVTRVVVFAHDITARKKTEAKHKSEHQQLLSIFDSIDEPIYVTDPDTNELLYVNHATRKAWSAEVGQICYRALQERDTPCPFCTNDRIFGKDVGKPYIWEFQNKANRRWYRCIDRAIMWPDGRWVRYEMAIDIHEHKQAEEARKESEAMFRFLFEMSSDAIVLLDEASFVDCNDAALLLFGCASREEFCSKHPADLSPPAQPCGRDSLELANERIAVALRNGSCRFEWTHHRMDGTLFPAEVLLNPLELKNARLLQAVVRDISDRKRAEEALEAKMKELEEFNKVAVGRELRMIELKKEINHLLAEQGRDEKYRIPE